PARPGPAGSNQCGLCQSSSAPFDHSLSDGSRGARRVLTSKSDAARRTRPRSRAVEQRPFAQRGDDRNDVELQTPALTVLIRIDRHIEALKLEDGADEPRLRLIAQHAGGTRLPFALAGLLQIRGRKDERRTEPDQPAAEPWRQHQVENRVAEP